MEAKPITMCVLLFGDNLALAHRCLGSIWDRLKGGRTHIFDIRLGLNEIAQPTRDLVDWWTDKVVQHHRLPVIHYDCLSNACKYPLVRRMVFDTERPPAKYFMWFDDDSYLDGGHDFWAKVVVAMQDADMIGKLYNQGVRNKQWDWVVQQDWYNPAVGKPATKSGKRSFVFATGGWWTVRTEIFRKWNWPTPELKHCGGDSMLGELLRHQKLRLKGFEEGVRINADEKGRHSKARPRGESWNRVLLGTQGYVANPDVSHQTFEMVKRTYGCEETSC